MCMTMYTPLFITLLSTEYYCYVVDRFLCIMIDENCVYSGSRNAFTTNPGWRIKRYEVSCCGKEVHTHTHKSKLKPKA